jgi:serine/threonine-protein kinase HipA
VTTNVYIDGEREYALNLGKTKQWYQVTLDHFETWARKSDIPWRVIKPHLDDTMAKARYLWPNALNELPMDDIHKEKLKLHWQALQKDFRI